MFIEFGVGWDKGNRMKVTDGPSGRVTNPEAVSFFRKALGLADGTYSIGRKPQEVLSMAVRMQIDWGHCAEWLRPDCARHIQAGIDSLFECACECLSDQVQEMAINLENHI